MHKAGEEVVGNVLGACVKAFPIYLFFLNFSQNPLIGRIDKDRDPR